MANTETIQEAPTQQPLPPQKVRRQRSDGGFVALINKPYILLAILLLIGGVWLVQHLDIITNNLDKPYALLAGPALIGSLLVGWFVLTFFKAIASWCRLGWQSFATWRKQDGSSMWLVIAIFLLVSVCESGNYFNELLGAVSLFGVLGYAVSLVIDLVAVECMRARLGAGRMRDKMGKRLYLLGVVACASLSAFANTYTALQHYHEPTGTLIPALMVHMAPWTGMAFPLLIIFLSFTADYTADQTSSKLDPGNYKLQEEKRLKLLEIQRDMLRSRMTIEQEMDAMNAQHLKENEREFFLVSWLLRRKSIDMDYVVAQVTEELQKAYESQLEVMAKQQETTQQQLTIALQKMTDMQQHNLQVFASLQQDRREDIQQFITRLEQVKTESKHVYQDADKGAVNTTYSESEDVPKKPRSQGGQQENELLHNPEVQEVLKSYVILAQYLTRGVRSLTLEEIIEATGHSRKMVLNRIKDGTFAKTKNPNKFRVDSVIEWLKIAPLPRRQEADNNDVNNAFQGDHNNDIDEPITGGIPATETTRNGHSKVVSLFGEMPELTVS